MRLWTILPAVILFAAVSFAAEKSSTGPSTQPSETYKVRKGSLKLEVSTDSTLAALEPYEVKLKTKAYTGQFTVVSAAAHGAMVRKGETILELDPKPFNWAMEGAENELATARANLKKAEADAELAVKSEALSLRISEDALKNAEGSLKWFEEVDGPQMLRMADLQVKMQKSQVEDQDDELDQLRKMYKTEDLTTATADIVIKRAIRRLDVTKEMLKVQEERRDKTKSYDYPITRQRVVDAVEQAKQALTSLKNLQAQSAVTRKSGLATARIASEQAEQKLGDLKTDQANFSFKAAEDGMVMYEQLPDAQPGSDKRALKAGDKLTAGQTVMRVVYPGRLKMDVTLSEAQAFWVEPGMRARVTPAAFPQLSYDGTCGTVVGGNRASPPGFGFMAPVTLPPTDLRLVPGMKASVKIEAGKVEDVLLIPVAAVSGGKVMIKKDGKSEDRAVVLGKSDGEKVEVKDGLAEGDEILARAGK
jgi:multidrug efflux pump subunit AcrA (membrane-fusion protein)